MKQKIHFSILAMVLFSTSIFVSACIIRARVPAAVVVGPPMEYGFEPMLYNGYVVYYSDDGVPFYWAGGARVFLPTGVRAVYVDHWRAHRSAYIRWHKHRGHYYKTRHYRNRKYKGRRPLRTHDNRPVLHPKKKNKPVLRPRKESNKPTLKPRKEKKKKKQDKPTLRPKH